MNKEQLEKVHTIFNHCFFNYDPYPLHLVKDQWNIWGVKLIEGSQQVDDIDWAHDNPRQVDLTITTCWGYLDEDCDDENTLLLTTAQIDELYAQITEGH